jgi:hypothetical protein
MVPALYQEVRRIDTLSLPWNTISPVQITSVATYGMMEE